jgi:hypothetical protein
MPIITNNDKKAWKEWISVLDTRSESTDKVKIKMSTNKSIIIAAALVGLAILLSAIVRWYT